MKKLIVFGFLAALLGGCKTLDQMNKDMADLNSALISARTQGREPESTIETRVELPNDKTVIAEFEKALPVIQKVIGIHKCVKVADGVIALNKYSIPGVDQAGSQYPNDYWSVKYHDKNICLSVRSIDYISMPAKNAMQMRVVYYADDSGETVSYKFFYKKTTSGEWLLGQQPSRI